MCEENGVTMDKRVRIKVVCDQIIPGIYSEFKNKKLSREYCMLSLDRNVLRAYDLNHRLGDTPELDSIITETYIKYQKLYMYGESDELP